MNFQKTGSMALCALGALLAGSAHASIVLPSDTSWTAQNVRANATVAITDTNARSGNGSLEFTTTGDTACGPTPCQDKADYVHTFFNPIALGDFRSLSYDVYRDPASTAAAHLVPALRLLFDTGAGQTGMLIWEPIYNAETVTPGVWQTFDAMAGNFWMFLNGTGVITRYDLTLAEWAAGTDPGAGGIALESDTQILGISVGVGSGWTNPIHAFVDNVSYQAGTNEAVVANFEIDALAVPEPGGLALSGVALLALLGASRRKTKA